MRGGRLCLARIAVAGAFLALASGAAPGQTDGEPIALGIDIEGPIGPATADFVTDVFEEAHEDQVDLVVIRMDTPGGLVDSMRIIIRAILASDIPVATYVGPSGARAASAGTYILYASHVAAMAPGTNLGAATPVQMGGSPVPADDEEEDEADPMSAKAVNDAAAYIRSLAELRDRNGEWAERAVREAASLTADEAAQMDVIDLVAHDLDRLLAQIDGATVTVAGERQVVLDTGGMTVEWTEPGWQIRLLAIITNPNVAFILMMVGIYGLIFELANPGALVPGVIGAISLLIALYALSILPFDAFGLALVGLGILLMTAEAFVPSFGVLGIGGAIAFAFGASLMFDAGVPGFALAWPVIIGATVFSAGLLALALGYVWRAHRRPVAAGGEYLLGRQGRVLSWSGESGMIHVEGERWQATAHESLAPGQPVKVVDRRGLTLAVEPAEKGAEP